MSALSAASEEDLAWLATFSLSDLQCMDMRVSEPTGGADPLQDSDMHRAVRSFVLQAIVDWEALQAKLGASGEVACKLAAAQCVEQLDHLISNDLSRLKVMSRVIDMAFDRLGPLWHERLTAVRDSLHCTIRHADGAAAARFFELPRSGPVAAPATASFHRRRQPQVAGKGSADTPT